MVTVRCNAAPLTTFSWYFSYNSDIHYCYIAINTKMGVDVSMNGSLIFEMILSLLHNASGHGWNAENGTYTFKLLPHR